MDGLSQRRDSVLDVDAERRRGEAPRIASERSESIMVGAPQESGPGVGFFCILVSVIPRNRISVIIRFDGFFVRAICGSETHFTC